MAPTLGSFSPSSYPQRHVADDPVQPMPNDGSCDVRSRIVVTNDDSDEDFGEETDQPGRDVIIILIVFFEVSLAPASLLLGWFLKHPPLERFQWKLEDLGIGAAASLPMILFFLAILRWPLGPLRRIKQICEEEVIPLLSGSNWYELSLIALAAGVGEEMLFRGVIQSAIEGWLVSPVLGFVLASVLFGLLHPVSVAYVAIAALLGCYLGWLMVINGNLLTVIVAHSLYDLAALGYLLKWPLESEDTSSDSVS